MLLHLSSFLLTTGQAGFGKLDFRLVCDMVKRRLSGGIKNMSDKSPRKDSEPISGMNRKTKEYDLYTKRKNPVNQTVPGKAPGMIYVTEEYGNNSRSLWECLKSAMGVF